MELLLHRTIKSPFRRPGKTARATALSPSQQASRPSKPLSHNNRRARACSQGPERGRRLAGPGVHSQVAASFLSRPGLLALPLPSCPGPRQLLTDAPAPVKPSLVKPSPRRLYVSPLRILNQTAKKIT